MQHDSNTPCRLALAALLCGLASACAGEDGTHTSTSDAGQSPEARTGAELDVHLHVMSQTLMSLFTQSEQVAPGADDLVARLDEAGVARGIVLGYGYLAEFPDAALASAENDYAAAQAARYPERLQAFCGIDPLRPGASDEIDRCADQLGVAGLKLHLANAGLDTRLPEHVAALAAVFDRAQERDLPILMHSGSPLGLPLDSDAFLNLGLLIAERPSLRLLLAHCTNDADRDEMEVWLAGLDNGFFNRDTLFVDTSSCLKFYRDAPAAQKELIAWRLRKWGLERVLFGSDYDFIDPVETPAEALQTLRSYPFTPEELELILNNRGQAWLRGGPSTP